MTQPLATGSRFRAYLQFLAAILYYFLASSLAHHGARGFADDAWSPLIEQATLVFLLIVGFAAMGFWIDRQTNPLNEQGLPRRTGWPHEAGLGLATGWAMTLLCVLPMMLVGGIAITITTGNSAWGWLLADAAFFALAALAEEVAFRGYAFQCFVRAVGPIGATLGFAALYAILQELRPGATHATFVPSLAFTFLLSTAYLRTRALWVGWGINFGWKASRALLFGLAVNGVSSHSPVVQGEPLGPYWLTGGAYGLDDSWFAALVLFAAVPALFRLTRDLNYRYNAPVIVPAGIPVDLDAAARAQHEAAIGSASPALVQIGSATQSPSAPPDVKPALESAGSKEREGSQ
jgi:uncharacterized protein